MGMVLNSSPNNIAEFFAREQATGAASQVKEDKNWFETTLARLKTELENNNENQ